jgi:hypothetical protein
LAVGGDSPPWDAVLINLIVAISDLFVQNLTKMTRNFWRPEKAGLARIASVRAAAVWPIPIDN